MKNNILRSLLVFALAVVSDACHHKEFGVENGACVKRAACDCT